jgi:acyl carrier protein
MTYEQLLNTVVAEFRTRMRKDLEADVERTPLAELGIDSLDFFEAVMALEERLGCEIPIEKLDAATTVRSLCIVIDEQRRAV